MPPKKDTTSGEFASPMIAWAKQNSGISKDDFAQRFPKTMALLEAWEKPIEPALKIVSTVAGFRRGDLSHPAEAVLHPISSLRPDQIERILGEDKLIVELVEATIKSDPEANSA